jgi:hypothetical protein
MVLQNNDNLIDDIQRVGCLYLSLARMVEIEHNLTHNPMTLNTVWQESKSRGFINPDNSMRSPDQVIRLLGGNLVQVGQDRKGVVVFWGWASGTYRNYRYKVEKVLTYGAEGTHFRLCDRDGKLIYDPYSFKDYRHTVIPEFTLYTPRP